MLNRIKLYSVAAPLALMPLLDFSFSEIGPYLKGDEFRTFIASLISELLAGTVDAIIISAVSAFFAAFGA